MAPFFSSMLSGLPSNLMISSFDMPNFTGPSPTPGMTSGASRFLVAGNICSMKPTTLSSNKVKSSPQFLCSERTCRLLRARRSLHGGRFAEGFFKILQARPDADSFLGLAGEIADLKGALLLREKANRHESAFCGLTDKPYPRDGYSMSRFPPRPACRAA